MSQNIMCNMFISQLNAWNNYFGRKAHHHLLIENCSCMILFPQVLGKFTSTASLFYGRVKYSFNTDDFWLKYHDKKERPPCSFSRKWLLIYWLSLKSRKPVFILNVHGNCVINYAQYMVNITWNHVLTHNFFVAASSFWYWV